MRFISPRYNNVILAAMLPDKKLTTHWRKEFQAVIHHPFSWSGSSAKHAIQTCSLQPGIGYRQRATCNLQRNVGLLDHCCNRRQGMPFQTIIDEYKRFALWSRRFAFGN